VESHANAFAAEFLAPSSEIADSLPARAEWKRLLSLKETWGISMQALLFRARQLRVMPEHTYRRAMMEMGQRGWRTREPGDDGGAEEPAMLRRAIELAGEAGVNRVRLSEESRLSEEMIELIAPSDSRPRVEM
jgi:Zn-dependent peptidase ImmA (M78 family)